LCVRAKVSKQVILTNMLHFLLVDRERFQNVSKSAKSYFL